MNQAVVHAEGSYYYFLNCGDSFYDEKVLEQLKAAITEKVSRGEQEDETAGETGRIFYGDQYDMLQHTVVASNPHMDAFACYRNVPCHQVCIYGAELFAERGYNPEYKVRGDYEHFLWCFFEKKIMDLGDDLLCSRLKKFLLSRSEMNKKTWLKRRKIKVFIKSSVLKNRITPPFAKQSFNGLKIQK